MTVAFWNEGIQRLRGVNVDVSTWCPHGFPIVNDKKLSVLVINGWLKSIEFVFRMNFYLVNQIRKLLYENSQESFHEQFWRGNWQPGHTATIICSVKSYKMRNGNLSFSTWLRCATKIIRKCYVAMTNCLLDMRCLSPKRVACPTDRFIQGGYMPCSSCTP
jgi:hypothetical protein